MLNLLDYSHYHDAVRTAHELVEIIKRRRPETREQVGDLQNIVTRSHQRLDELQRASDSVQVLAHSNCGDGTNLYDSDLCGQVAEELNTLQAALEALNDLRHASPISQEQAHQGQCAECEPKRAPDDILSDSTVMKQSENERFDSLFSD